MSEPGDWNVDSFKNDYEPEEHWQLRKKFILAHKSRIPQDELISLAQLFLNIEFLGCRYPSKTMAKIAELAKGIVEEFRDSRKCNLKRTFVSASDAASLKINSQRMKGGGQRTNEVAAENENQSKKTKVGKVAESKLPSILETTIFRNPFHSSFIESCNHEKSSTANVTTNGEKRKRAGRKWKPKEKRVVVVNEPNEIEILEIPDCPPEASSSRETQVFQNPHNFKSIESNEKSAAPSVSIKSGKKTRGWKKRKRGEKKIIQTEKESCTLERSDSLPESSSNMECITVFESLHPSSSIKSDNEKFNVPSSSSISNKSTASLKTSDQPFSGFVLFIDALEDESPFSIIQGSANLNNQKMKWRCQKAGENGRKWSLFLNNELVASKTGADTKSVMKSVAQAALDKLKQCCYCIKVNANVYSEVRIDRSTLELGFSSGQTKPPVEELKQKKSNLEKELGSDNVGLKIMKLMGWYGGGLGINEQGIEEPIKPPTQVRRKGLGLDLRKKQKQGKNNVEAVLTKKQRKKMKNGGDGLGRIKNNFDLASFKEKFRNYVQKWIESNPNYDLVFSSDFDNVERKAMHKIAKQMSLTTKSYGNDNDRRLILSRKFLPWELVQKLKTSGERSDTYELIYPSGSS